METRLVRYADGDLRLADRLEVEFHLERCADCREELSTLRATYAHVRGLLEHPSPRYQFARLRQAMAELSRTKRTMLPMPAFSFRLVLQRAALLALLVLGLGLAAEPVGDVRHAPFDSADLRGAAAQPVLASGQTHMPLEMRRDFEKQFSIRLCNISQSKPSSFSR